MVKVIIKTYENIRGEIVAEIEMVDGRVEIKTPLSSLREELSNGIIGRDGRKFTLDDGEDFIYELPYVYSGSMVRAEMV